MNQNYLILNHLEAGNPITPMDALKLFNCFRLGARIYELKRMGHQISARKINTLSGKKVAEYRLVKS
jgi:hypothetical protein